MSHEATLTTGVGDTRAVLERFVLGDLLDDSILGARPGDKSFPLRVLFGELGSRLAEDASFTLLSGLNFFFRSHMEEEDKVRVGFEVSRLYYAFAREIGMEEGTRRETSPLLAALMSSELNKVALESVDHAPAFDSKYHEREPGADPHGVKIKSPASFLVKVSQNAMVRLKARVLT